MTEVKLIFAQTPQELAGALLPYPAVFVVADRKIEQSIAMPLVELCAENGVAIRGFKSLKTSEKRKNLDTVGQILDWLICAGADRNSLVLAIGGGITTDLAGFAACIFERGIRYANVPTTLLAQTDAAIGGKTGCNVSGFKNMAGVIKQPEFTFICPEFIMSLPWEEFTAGYAELLKTFLIADSQAYEEAVADSGFEHTAELVRKAAEIKADIVTRDEFESDERKKLNLGHTFAHAIEKMSKGKISHGHAVSMGIIMAAKKSEREGLAKPGLADRLTADFENVGLPTESPWTEDELAAAMMSDKKVRDSIVHYVLFEDIAKVKVI